MLTIAPCYAPEDAAAAREIAEFIERGTGARVFFEEGRLRPGEDLIGKVRDGRMADVVLALLSPASSPARWPLAAWQEAFRDGPEAEGVLAAALLLADCRYPPLLARRNFFDLRGGRLAALRAVKRRVLDLRRPPGDPAFVPALPKAACPDVEIERLAAAIADRPGTAGTAGTAAALRFACNHGPEFEAVLWLSGPDTPAARAGDLAAQLGMRAEGPPEEVLVRLARTCAGHRLLILAAGAELPVDLGPLASVLRIAETPRPVPPDLEPEAAALLAAMAACGGECSDAEAAESAGLDAARLGAAWSAIESRGLALRLDARAPRYRLLAAPAPPCGAPPVRAGGLIALRRAFLRALAENQWTRACEAGRRAASMALAAGRNAEAFEILDALAARAQSLDDPGVFDYCAGQQGWILEGWGRIAEAQALRGMRRALCSEQRSFDFLISR